MSSNNASGKVVSVDEQAFEKAGGQAVDEDGFPVVDETPEFEAAVEQETQTKVDANHPDGIADTSKDRIHGVTLEQEERIRAREAGLERISAQAEPGTQDGREQRTREVVSEQCGRDKPAPAERTDPREKRTQDELAAVNEQAMRISDEVQGDWSRAVVAKQLAEKVQRGQDVTKAVLETLEELKAAPGANRAHASVTCATDRGGSIDSALLSYRRWRIPARSSSSYPPIVSREAAVLLAIPDEFSTLDLLRSSFRIGHDTAIDGPRLV